MYFSLLMTSCCPVSPKHGLSIHFGVELLCCEKKKKKAYSWLYGAILS